MEKENIMEYCTTGLIENKKQKIQNQTKEDINLSQCTMHKDVVTQTKNKTKRTQGYTQ